MKLNRRVVYNQTVNVVWTAIGFAPIFYFWLTRFDLPALSIILGLSFIPWFVPSDFFKLFQLSRERKTYHALGIKHFQNLAQDGRLINASLGRKSLEFKKSSIEAEIGKFRSKIKLYEKYHWMCFVLFMGSLGFAVSKNDWLIAFLILMANLIYNVVPILIQQYNKIRIGIFN